jgi:hypothetical protein
MHFQNDPHENNHKKFAWKMGSNQNWPGITISREIGWVRISKILRDLLPAWLRIDLTNIRSWKN